MAVAALPAWAVYTFYAVSAAATVAGAAQPRKAGYLQREAMAERAEEEKLAAQEEGNIRREKLLKAMSAASAAGGASGLTGETPSLLQLQAADEFEKEQFGREVMGSAKQRQLSREGTAAAKTGKYQAGDSLISGLTPIAKELS